VSADEQERVESGLGNMPGLRRGRKWYCDVGGTRVGLVKCRETSELLGMSSEQVGEDVGAVTRCEGCSPYNYPLSRKASTRCECVEA